MSERGFAQPPKALPEKPSRLLKKSLRFRKKVGRVKFFAWDGFIETSARFARGDNEFARAGLTMAQCRLVAAPRVAESPAALERKVVEVVEIKSLSGAWSGAVLTLGEVVAFHIDERFLRDGRFDTALAHPVARCGYQDYASVEAVFALARPKGGGDGVS